MFPAWMKFDKEQTESDAAKERPSLFIFKKIRDPQRVLLSRSGNKERWDARLVDQEVSLQTKCAVGEARGFMIQCMRMYEMFMKKSSI